MGCQIPRVEVVTAWIYRCAVSALGLTFKTTWMQTVVNLRKRMVPPLPERCVGTHGLVVGVQPGRGQEEGKRTT